MHSKRVVFGAAVFTIVLCGLVLVGFFSYKHFRSKTTKKQNSAESIGQNQVISDYSSPSVDEIRKTEPDSNIRYRLFMLHGYEKASVGKTTEAEAYYRAAAEDAQDKTLAEAAYVQLYLLAVKSKDEAAVLQYKSKLDPATLKKINNNQGKLDEAQT